MLSISNNRQWFIEQIYLECILPGPLPYCFVMRNKEYQTGTYQNQTMCYLHLIKYDTQSAYLFDRYRDW